MKTQNQEIDAVEDLILDDFSFGDSDSEDKSKKSDGPFDEVGRHSSRSSADEFFSAAGKPRSQSMIDGAFRQRGK